MRGEGRNVALLALAIALVFHDWLLHPTGVLASEASDALAQAWPTLHFLVQGLREQGFPYLWNPYQLTGMPTLGDPQAWVFYPPSWLLAVLPADRVHELLAPWLAGHLLLGGMGVLYWLRSWDFPAPARLAAALTFALAGKWMAHLLIPHHLVFAPLAWVPWQLGLIDRLWRRPRPLEAGVLALVTAMFVLGMHPQVALYSCTLGAVYAVWAGLRGPRASWTAPVAWLLVAGVLAVGMTLAETIPTLEVARDTVRGAGELDYEHMAAGRTQVHEQLERMVSHPPTRPFARWEGVVHVGLVSLALSTLAWVRPERRRESLFWAGVLVVLVLFAGATFVHRVAHEVLPGFDRMRIPSRAIFLMSLPLAWLAACGTEALASRLSPRARLLPWLAAAAGAWAWLRGFEGATAWTVAMLSAPAVLALAGGRAAVPWLAVLAVAVDLVAFATPLMQVAPLREVVGEHPAVPLLAAPQGTHRVLGVGSLEGALPITYGVPGRLELGNGYNPMMGRPLYRYMRIGLSRMDAPPTDATMLHDLKVENEVYLRPLGFRWVVGRDEVSHPGLVLRHVLGGFGVYNFAQDGLVPIERFYVYEDPEALPRAWLVRDVRVAPGPDEAREVLGGVDPAATVVLEEPVTVSGSGPLPPVQLEFDGDARRTTVQVEGSAVLALGEVWHPGWRAWDGGREIPVLRAGGLYCAIPLGPGRHELEIRYLPRSYETLRWVSLGCLLAALGLLLAPRRRSPFGRAGSRQQAADRIG